MPVSSALQFFQTLNTYSHLYPNKQAEVAQQLENLINGTTVEGEDLPQEEGPSIWHSAPKTGLRDPSAAVPIGIAVTGAFLFLTAGRSERRKE